MPRVYIAKSRQKARPKLAPEDILETVIASESSCELAKKVWHKARLHPRAEVGARLDSQMGYATLANGIEEALLEQGTVVKQAHRAVTTACSRVKSLVKIVRELKEAIKLIYDADLDMSDEIREAINECKGRRFEHLKITDQEAWDS